MFSSVKGLNTPNLLFCEKKNYSPPVDTDSFCLLCCNVGQADKFPNVTDSAAGQ